MNDYLTIKIDEVGQIKGVFLGEANLPVSGFSVTALTPDIYEVKLQIPAVNLRVEKIRSI